VDPATDRISVYYGAADTVTGLAHGYVSEIIDSIRR
jgi:beta-1,4-mannooligosaccharide/beta-1,4-mannosyl-N-acetylglucosamine phosphorylase